MKGGNGDKVGFEQFWSLLTFPLEIMTGLAGKGQVPEALEAPYVDILEDRREAHRAGGRKLYQELRQYEIDPVFVAHRVLVPALWHLLDQKQAWQTQAKVIRQLRGELLNLKADLLRREDRNFLRAEFLVKTEKTLQAVEKAMKHYRRPFHGPVRHHRNALVRFLMDYFTKDAPTPMKPRTAARLVASLFFYSGIDLAPKSPEAILKQHARLAALPSFPLPISPPD